MQPYSTRRVAALWLALLLVPPLLCCAQRHGSFAALASRSIHSSIDRAQQRAAQRTTGRACYSPVRALFGLPDDALVRATREALAAFPAANALVLVEFEDYGACIEIKGLAVTIE